MVWNRRRWCAAAGLGLTASALPPTLLAAADGNPAADKADRFGTVLRPFSAQSPWNCRPVEPVLDESSWRLDGWRERTARALTAMPEAQRQALVLRYLDRLAVPEIAVALGRSPHAVESLLARGRISFKRRYLEAGNDDA